MTTTMIHVSGLFLFLYNVGLIAFMGFVIRAYLKEGKLPWQDSKIWHALALVVRILPLIYVEYLCWFKWPYMILYGLFAANWGFTCWNVGINWIRGLPALYLGSQQSGTSSTIDSKIPHTLIYLAQLILFILTCGYVIAFFFINT
jgi:hypothetical protein